jgi:hypothetical protein
MAAPSGAGTAAGDDAVAQTEAGAREGEGDGLEEVCAAARPVPVNRAAADQRIPFLTTVLGFKGWNWIARALSDCSLGTRRHRRIKRAVGCLCNLSDRGSKRLNKEATGNLERARWRGNPERWRKAAAQPEQAPGAFTV